MRKKIAVFICAISFSNQKKILEGILHEAKEEDLDVFVFTCHVNHSASYMKINGAFSVMTLPDFSKFDGAIIMKSTIRQPEIVDELVRKIRDSKVPAVSIEEELDGMHYVGISDYEAQKKIVDHVINEHHARNICYVTGLLDSNDGKERFRAFKDSIKEHGIEYDEESVYYGNYINDSGKDAVRHFLKSKKNIDAIICANDGMALGVIGELSKAGIRVPEDVMVTGFDNDTYSRYSLPMLTTIDQNQGEIGKTAVKLLSKSSDCSQQKAHISSRLVLGESCGCVKNVDYSMEEIRTSYSKEIGVISQAVDEMKNMSIELACLTTMEELYKRLPKYVLASDMEAFFLCIEEKEDKLSIPLAYVDGDFTEVKAYHKGNVLPDSVRDTKDPQFYIVTSLFHSDMNFGYIIQRGSRFALESELAYSWVVNIGIAVENIRKIKVMQDMLDRLNTMWMYDTLTNLYNRGGFYHFAQPLLEDISLRKGKCYLLFCDLDGLKTVNDNLGHEEGDRYIAAMAEVIKNTVNIISKISPDHIPIAMRYGGDEFVLFGECQNEEKALDVKRMVFDEIDHINKEKDKFALSCSIGLSIHEASEIDNLNSLLEEADQSMYESKKIKKASKKVR